jgi:molybdate transport system regulatory protein
MHVKLRLDFNDSARFGPGKAALLEMVAAHGSITAAAKAMDMSYRRAWRLVDEVNAIFAGKLVEAKPGGSGGGGAMLTPLGREVLALYRGAEAYAAAAPCLKDLQLLIANAQT